MKPPAGRLLPLLLCAAACGAAAAPRPGAAPPPGPSRPAPRPSIAFSRDGARVAIAGYGEVVLLDVRAGKPAARLAGHAGAVNCVAFSPDGRFLAAAGGVPGRSGEIRIWDLGTRKARVLAGHADAVYSVSWSPDGRTLAAGSYDRLVSLWEVGPATSRMLKDHTDAVYAVAFSPDGSRIASASGDRTVKVWDPVSGRRLFTLSDATAELYCVAFHPSGRELTAAGVDRMLRKWSLEPASGTLARSAFAHDGPVLRVVYTPDGEGLFTSSEDRSVKLWDAAALAERRVFEPQPDWALGLAVSGDAGLLAVSRYDGSVALYDAATGAKRAEPFRSPPRRAGRS